MKTYSAKVEDIKRLWYVIDGTNKTLGRLASAIAIRLRGKHKPEYTPHADTGDYIILTNAKAIKVTGNKLNKVYYRHTGYPGGVKTTTFSKLINSFPEKVITHAVKGMLPKNTLGRQMLKKLKIYAEHEHPHLSQQPIVLEV